jgi:hypothetical protein
MPGATAVAERPDSPPSKQDPLLHDMLGFVSPEPPKTTLNIVDPGTSSPVPPWDARAAHVA